MKQKCIIFGNCQGHAIKVFLEKLTDFANIYDVTAYANWQLLKTPTYLSIPYDEIKNADLIIYQPLNDVHGCYSTNIKNSDSFLNLLKPECKCISFPRIHNNAIFPIFNKKQHNRMYYGYVLNKYDSKEQLLKLYDQNKLDFDFEKRMHNNYEIGKEKESECDIKMIDFIYSSIKTHKLFLTHDHPTSYVFSEITRQICNILDLEFDYEKSISLEENMMGLPDSVYNRSDKQYPISRYAIKYFDFKYIKNEHTDADLFYRNILKQI
jgi:hypothetical protein